jgi:hypothetical protein
MKGCRADAVNACPDHYKGDDYMSDTQVCSQRPAPVKRAPWHPVELAPDEMVRLIRAFTEGKTAILEDDALVLVQWAQQMRFGAMVLEMVLDGDLTPIVEDGKVLVARRTSGGEAA